MVVCKNCGYENPDEYIFCMHCSKKLDSTNISQESNQTSFENNDLQDLYCSFIKNTPEDASASMDHNNFNTLEVGKKQFIAVALSSILWGAGYFYLKNTNKGLLFFFGQIFLMIFAYFLYYIFKTSTLVTAIYIVSILVYLFSVYDTLVESNKNGDIHG